MSLTTDYKTTTTKNSHEPCGATITADNGGLSTSDETQATPISHQPPPCPPSLTSANKAKSAHPWGRNPNPVHHEMTQVEKATLHLRSERQKGEVDC